MLLMWVVPQLLQEPAPATAQLWLVRYGLPLLPLAIAVIRVDAARGEGQVVVDLFYSMLLFLLVLVLVLGSLVVKQVSDSDYPWALAQTLFVIALLLVALSWLWNPRGGFAGLGQMLSRYLLSLGLPFERWVNSLAELAQDESQPEQFLQAALQGMLGMPWVTGLEWRTAAGGGEIGRKSSHASDFAAPDLMLRVFTRWQPSPAILLHVKLLAQIVGYFYRAKQREQLQRRNAYAQAIHETGARLTHDVKNLLQSLHSLCAAAEISGPERAAELQALMQRQLPLVTQRLSDTLDKLRAPQVVSVGTVDAAKWWETLMERYSAREIHFALESAHDGKRLCVPAELYDRVADNLIENGLRKRAHSPDTALTVTFSLADSGRLAVCDTGLPIEEGLARQLFIAPVASRSGLGVGLYHAACQAAELGYVLRLAANETGKVCFELRRCAVPPA
jgi:signal transduction histidine kinase